MDSNEAGPSESTGENYSGAQADVLSKEFETGNEEDDESTIYSLVSVDTEAADNVSVTYKGVEIIEPLPIVKSDLCILTPRDTMDPSYSNLKLPYRVVCRQRLYQKSKRMKQQFIEEVEHNELVQKMAIDGIRLHRIFSGTVSYNRSKVMKLTDKQKTKLEMLLAQPF